MAKNRKHCMEHIMARIIKIRYTNLEEEKKLCEELLDWEKVHEDPYCKAFALTYLGDYYIAVYDEKSAGKCLLEAESLIKKVQCGNELKMRLYSLLGIYYEIRADEQNSVDYYLKAITVAEILKDAECESAVLNNLALVFQRNRCYDEALKYYIKAYELQAELKNSPIISTVMGNLIEISLIMHNYEAAKGYIEESARIESDSYQNKIWAYKNWCGYYSAIGDREKALEYAELFLKNKKAADEDKLAAFETYYTLCNNMMDLKEPSYAGRFLHAMEETDIGGGLDRMKMMEETAIRYALLFESSEKHAVAYRRFYQMNQKLRAKINDSISNAMKSKIRLDQLMQQTELMQSEQKSLEREASLDELTKIYSRGFLEILIQNNANRSNGENLGFIMLDVDYFKEYNDYYGHIKGDVVLREIGACLMENKIAGVYPCRYGGDEFVCVCENLPESEMEAYIKRIRTALHTKALPHEKSPCSNEITLSIGFAVDSKKTQIEVNMLLQLADQALYQSKRSGRNTYTIKRADV